MSDGSQDKRFDRCAYMISAPTVENWKQQFLAHASRAFESEADSAEQERIAALERMVGKPEEHG